MTETRSQAPDGAQTPSRAGEVTISPAILDREIILQQKHAIAYWQNRALVLAQQVEDMHASLEEKVKAAVEAKLSEAGKAKAK